MKTIELSHGQVSWVDDEDFEWLSQWKWSASWCQHTHSYYAVRRIDTETGQKKLRLHRVIVGAKEKEKVDHLDHDTLNNQKVNLRRCTSSQNNANARLRTNNTSGFKGVSWKAANRKWQAAIRINRRDIYLGLFSDPVVAAQAYDAKAIELFGEFAMTNSDLARL